MPAFVWLLILSATAEMAAFGPYATWLLWPAMAQ
jgi:hypothetical protein